MYLRSQGTFSWATMRGAWEHSLGQQVHLWGQLLAAARLGQQSRSWASRCHCIAPRKLPGATLTSTHFDKIHTILQKSNHCCVIASGSWCLFCLFQVEKNWERILKHKGFSCQCELIVSHRSPCQINAGNFHNSKTFQVSRVLTIVCVLWASLSISSAQQEVGHTVMKTNLTWAICGHWLKWRLDQDRCRQIISNPSRLPRLKKESTI